MANMIRELRKQKKWSQSYLAAKLGWTQADVSRAESGVTSLTADKIKRLAEAFNVRQAVILGEEAVEGAWAAGGVSEPPPETLVTPEPSPMLGWLMGLAYGVWYETPAFRSALSVEDLPTAVYALHKRLQSEKTKPDEAEIKKRLADMIALLVENARQKERVATQSKED